MRTPSPQRPARELQRKPDIAMWLLPASVFSVTRCSLWLKVLGFAFLGVLCG